MFKSVEFLEKSISLCVTNVDKSSNQNDVIGLMSALSEH